MVILGDTIEYCKHLKEPRKLLEPINIISGVSLYNEEKKVLQGFVHNKAEQKTLYYNKKIAEMQQKYDMDFSDFQDKIWLRPAEAGSEEWNDFVLWGSYIKAYRYWAQLC